MWAIVFNHVRFIRRWARVRVRTTERGRELAVDWRWPWEGVS